MQDGKAAVERVFREEYGRLIASLVDDRGCAVVAVTHDPDVERVLGDRTLRLGAS